MSADARHGRAETPSALPPGTRLHEFEVKSLLGIGGFGIVYLAFDHALERQVAVKEYMPAALAGRTATMHVSLRSPTDAETFALGLKSFVNEARLLARFDHPALLKVLRFWEANGTAYMAMPVLRGRTLKQTRLAMAQPPDEAWLRKLLDALLGAIETLHEAGVYHRDIAPDNIQIEPDGRPVLLDFGAARRVISDKSQTLTAILKPAYAPIEQYAEAASVRQGPWTDLYALGATLHYVMLSRPPPPATARTIHDEASALTEANVPGCSAAFLHIVDWMLAPRPADRPQSVAALRDALDGRSLPLYRRRDEPPPSPWERTQTLGSVGTVEIPLDLGDLPTTAAAAPSPVPPSPATRAEPPPPLQPAPLPEPALMAAPVADALDLPLPAARTRLLPTLLGLGMAVALALGAVALWPKAPALPAADVAAAAVAQVASAASAAALADALAAAAPALPPVPQQPESTIATVVVPERPRPRPAADAHRATPAPAPAPAAPAPVVVEAPAPAPPVAASVPPPPASALAPPVEPPKPAVLGPEASCAGKNPLMYLVCMESACLSAQFRSHADCLNWRKGARRE